VLEKQQNKNGGDMKKKSEFPFDRARQVTPEENQKFREAISEQFGINLRNRPIRSEDENYEPISIRLHLKVLNWAKEEAQKRGIGYQTVINEVLLELVG
jgi:uncharacterized protein (DUF4415 family)